MSDVLCLYYSRSGKTKKAMLEVAEALDAQRRIGLCVTGTDLLLPRKSMTALLGVSDHPVKGHLAGCGHCALRARCEYRKRGKTCASQ